MLITQRGPGGGFCLSRPSESIRLIDIVAPIDPLQSEGVCLLRLGRCDEENPCSAHARWQEVMKAYVGFLTETTLAELAGRDDAKSP